LKLKNSDLKLAILQLYYQCVQTATSENGVANCNVSLVLSPNLVYFGPQTATNETRVSIY